MYFLQSWTVHESKLPETIMNVSGFYCSTSSELKFIVILFNFVKNSIMLEYPNLLIYSETIHY